MGVGELKPTEEELSSAVYEMILENGYRFSDDHWKEGDSNIKYTLAQRSAIEVHLEILKFLVKKEPSLLTRNIEEKYGDYQQPVLELVVEYGHFDRVKYLVEECNCDIIFEERIRDPSALSNLGAINPIQTAARYGQAEVLERRC